MSPEGKAELYAIKVELNKIIMEMEDISFGIRTNFLGIGNDKCSESINGVAAQYRLVRKKLENIDPTSINTDYSGRNSTCC